VNTVRSDFLEMMPHVGETLSKREAGDIERFYAAFADANGELLGRRFAEGRIREGHGDLRAEHICLVDPIVVFDCVEFSERLRTVDVASEIAFLAMDLDFLGEPALAEDLVSAYAKAAHDDDLRRLLPFYGCYRACVRGKVETLKSGESEVPPRERVQARLRARRYFRLALRYALGAPRPALILVCGPAGTGKSTVARLVAADTGFPIRSSDVVRKRLAGIPVTARASGGYLEGIYRPEFSRRTYDRLLEETGRLLRSGRGAIVEATFLERVHRRPFVDLARALRVPLVVVECRAGEAEVLRRLDERASDPEEPSDAGRDVYFRHTQVFEPPTEVPPAERLVAETDRDLEALPDELRSLLGSTRQ
jgi:hypothetical protein